MRTVSQQIGWSQEAKLLYEIQRELDYLYNTTWNTIVNPTTTTTTTIFVCIDADVIIGTQTWKVCNLNVDTYRNGDPIPQVTDLTEWVNLTTGAWCYYNNDPALGAIYGKIYNWYAVNDPRGLAPSGYHVPSDIEFVTLTDYLGGLFIAGGAMKETGTLHWQDPNNGATNSSGFSALPGGCRSEIPVGFTAIGLLNFYWTSLSRHYISLYNSSIDVTYSTVDNWFGCSVRLIKD